MAQGFVTSTKQDVFNSGSLPNLPVSIGRLSSPVWSERLSLAIPPPPARPSLMSAYSEPTLTPLKHRIQNSTQ